MGDKIPIKFEHEGAAYTGTFDAVSGAGADSSTWFLMINRYYKGTLQLNGFGWVFNSNDGMFKELNEWFGDYMIAWHDSNPV